MVWSVCILLINKSSLLNYLDQKTIKMFIDGSVIWGILIVLNVQYSSDDFNSKVFCCWLSNNEKGKHLKSKSLLLESCKLGGYQQTPSICTVSFSCVYTKNSQQPCPSTTVRALCLLIVLAKQKCPWPSVPHLSNVVDSPHLHFLWFPVFCLSHSCLFSHRQNIFQCICGLKLYWEDQFYRLNCFSVRRFQWLMYSRPRLDGPWAASGEKLSKWGLNLAHLTNSSLFRFYQWNALLILGMFHN